MIDLLRKVPALRLGPGRAASRGWAGKEERGGGRREKSDGNTDRLSGDWHKFTGGRSQSGTGSVDGKNQAPKIGAGGPVAMLRGKTAWQTLPENLALYLEYRILI